MAVSASQLRENQQILVKGVLSFSRLSKLIEGKELTDRVAAEKARGIKFPTDKPHTTITIVDAEVLPADPQAATPEEIYVHERIFTYNKGENAGKQALTVDNKSTYLPNILAPSKTEAGAYEQVKLERDLASGIPVTLVINTYGSASFANKGIGLQQVVLHEEVRYYASGATAAISALAARGIVVTGSIENVAAPAPGSADETAAAQAAFAAEADRSGFVIPDNTGVTAGGLPFPTPGAQGTAPVAAPASAFPIAGQTAAPQVPVAQQIAQTPLAAPAQLPLAQTAPVETPEQELARLRQQLAERESVAAATGPSAFDVAQPAAAAPGPWDVPVAGPVAVQG